MRLAGSSGAMAGLGACDGWSVRAPRLVRVRVALASLTVSSQARAQRGVRSVRLRRAGRERTFTGCGVSMTMCVITNKMHYECSAWGRGVCCVAEACAAWPRRVLLRCGFCKSVTQQTAPKRSLNLKVPWPFFVVRSAEVLMSDVHSHLDSARQMCDAIVHG